MALDGFDFRSAFARHKPTPNDIWIRSVLNRYRAAGISFLRDGGDRFGAGLRASQLAPEYGIDYLSPAFPICREGHYGTFIGKAYRDMEEYRALIHEVRELGGGFIKIMISGIMDFNHFGAITSHPLPYAEIREMVHIAHDQGFSVMAHANGARLIEDAVRAGVDSVEHGAYMDDDAVCAIAAAKIAWVPTVVTIANLIGEGRYPDEVLRPLFELHMENIRRCASLGGIIACGSDAGAYRV
ncbi:MAG: amidohydrolase family protein, partial [Clostridia bacterium]|nr:amidohydrolase family protein [Clostridia bacterium]